MVTKKTWLSLVPAKCTLFFLNYNGFESIYVFVLYNSCNAFCLRFNKCRGTMRCRWKGEQSIGITYNAPYLEGDTSIFISSCMVPAPQLVETKSFTSNLASLSLFVCDCYETRREYGPIRFQIPVEQVMKGGAYCMQLRIIDLSV